jgi:hypothetical protein
MGEDEGKGDVEVRVFNPPQTLAAKVEIGGPGAVDMATLERAEQVISDMAGDYINWVQEDLRLIQEAMDEVKSSGGESEGAMSRVFAISHDIKGQGGSFGYDLMTMVGDDLCRIIDHSKKADTSVLDVMQVHIDTMKLIIKSEMKGDGGAEGVKLLKGLELVASKVQAT